MPSIFFGDLHNHNDLGYGKGSFQRAIDIAKEHLDFFAFTGHSSWHDIPRMEGQREEIWTRGFDRLRDAWPDVVRMTAEANDRHDFAAFLGFEWHSSAYGDQCVIFPGDEGDIVYPDHIADLRAYCLQNGALMIPHHLAYPTGHRGVNWDVFEPDCSPFVEIYSEHGNSEDDRGAYPFFSHSFGGRITSNTVRAALRRGLRFGFSASSDNHRGFPGGYGEGIVAVIADELARPALLDAIRSRRLYALTGERIEMDFTVEGAPMGAEVPKTGSVHVALEVRGRDELDLIEIIQDGRIVRRLFPEVSRPVRGVLQMRVEWGWGPWPDMDLSRVADWQFSVEVDDGTVGRIFPCLQSGPFDEDRRHRIRRTDASRIEVISYTGRRGSYRGNPNQSLVCEVIGDQASRIRLNVAAPRETGASFTLDELLESGRMVYTGPFPAEALLIHRPVEDSASTIRAELDLPVPDRPSYVYVRARQKNGHLAWSSPVFLNY